MNYRIYDTYNEEVVKSFLTADECFKYINRNEWLESYVIEKFDAENWIWREL